LQLALQVVGAAVWKWWPTSVVVKFLPNFANPAGPLVRLKDTAICGEGMEQALGWCHRVAASDGKKEQMVEAGVDLGYIEIIVAR
jgi:hypothetical protein